MHLRTIGDRHLIENDFEIQLYPNPTNMDYVTLEIKGVNDAVIQVLITDLHGKVFVNQTMNIGQSQTLLSLQHLPNGLYVVYVKTRKAVKSTKLIISK